MAIRRFPRSVRPWRKRAGRGDRDAAQAALAHITALSQAVVRGLETVAGSHSDSLNTCLPSRGLLRYEEKNAHEPAFSVLARHADACPGGGR